ncbi:MAG: hypothetical protein GEU79_11910 [Acidimicrobiia bacterium]|nr:hypothetical protein [Acidimicrobiia bacterium]
MRSANPEAPSRIELTVPANEDYLAMVRVVTGRAAGLAGFSFNGTDDLCLAVAEAATLLIATDPATLDVSLVVESDAIDGEVAITDPSRTWPPSGLEEDMRWQILDAVFDESWTLTDGRMGIGWRQPSR